MPSSTRRSLLVPALLSLAACRCGLLAPGLGYGVEGAPAQGTRTEAEAMASLALVVDARDGQARTAPVVAVRGGKAVVLWLDGAYADVLPRLEATFVLDGGRRHTAKGATILAEQRDARVTLLAFDVGDLPVKPVAVAPAGEQADLAKLRVVSLRSKEPPMVRDLEVKTPLGAATPNFDGTAVANPGSGGTVAIFDAAAWRLVAVGRASGGTRDTIQGFGVATLLGHLAGVPRSARLEVATAPDGCRVTASVALDDPAGTVREVGLVVGEPGVAWAIPPLVHVRLNERQDAESQVAPVGKGLADRKVVTAPGLVELSAVVKECEAARFAQVLIIGDGERWLSWPYRLPPAGGPPVQLATGRVAWRVDPIPAAEPLVWKGTPMAAPPEPGAEPGCRPSLSQLDPEGVHVVGRRRVVEQGCADGVLVFPVGEEERARCAQVAPFLHVAADGWPIYRVGEQAYAPVAWRRAVPDRNAPGEGGACRLVSPTVNDDVLAAGPCGHEAPEATFHAPEGELLFACREGTYRRRDGSALDLHGGQLIRSGEGGRALVRLPWGGLGVIGPDGKGREVGGLPMGTRLDRPMPSTATADGFLVALETELGPRPWARPELFHVSADGKATSRGRFGPLEQDGGFARYLAADGALLTLNEQATSARAPIRRWVAGQVEELLYDPARIAPEYQLEDVHLLLGGRSAGPVVPGPWSRSATSGLRSEDDALKTYLQADPALLPCGGTLSAFEPDRVYLQLDGQVLDLADQTRFSWLPQDARVRMGGDGRLLQHHWAGNRSEVQIVPDPRAALRPTWDGQRCVRFAGHRAEVELAPGATCGGAQFEVWAPVPGAARVVAACGAPGGPQDQLVGDRRLSVARRLRHAGLEGRLLLERQADWTVVDPEGHESRVAGLPEPVRAIRAVKAGFVLVVTPAKPRAKNALDLVLITDDGRLRKLGGYDGLPDQLEVESAALDAAHALHVLAIDRAGAGRSLLYRIPLGGRQAEVVWEQRAYASQRALLTGP